MRNREEEILAQKALLDALVEKYNQQRFIEDDPISLPHRFAKPRDQEVLAFWVSCIAWGRRASIIKSGEKLLELFEGEPYEFVKNHSEEEAKRFNSFYHRTFQPADALFFLHVLQAHYRKEESLETMFLIDSPAEHIGPLLSAFAERFFSGSWVLERSRKHIPSPARASSCKRLCMFLRWMVRCDAAAVDFGIWKRIKASQLQLPLDVHVQRQAQKLGLLQRKQRDWKAVLELGEAMRLLDAQDPARYDFALFGLGIEEQGGWL